MDPTIGISRRLALARLTSNPENKPDFAVCVPAPQGGRLDAGVGRKSFEKLHKCQRYR